MNKKSVAPVRILVMREGAPAVVECIPPTGESFANLVGDKPLMVGMTSDYSLVLSGEPADKARPNLRVVDAGGPGMGLIAGPCFVIKHAATGSVVSLDDCDIVALRGYMEARRVGAC